MHNKAYLLQAYISESSFNILAYQNQIIQLWLIPNPISILEQKRKWFSLLADNWEIWIWMTSLWMSLNVSPYTWLYYNEDIIFLIKSIHLRMTLNVSRNMVVLPSGGIWFFNWGIDIFVDNTKDISIDMFARLCK